MKIFAFVIYFAFSYCIANNASAMFNKMDKAGLGRPKLRKPTIGSIYVGFGAGIPMYGVTDINQTDVGAGATAAIQGSQHPATQTIPISIPIITASIGYIPLTIPVRHEISFAFLNNTYSIKPDSDLTIDGNPYKNPSISTQAFLLQYHLYGYYTLKTIPCTLFVGAGGGLVLYNTALSDSFVADKSTTSSGSAGTTPVNSSTNNRDVSPVIRKIGVGGVASVAIGGTYRFTDDMALQLRLGYKAMSSPFNNGPAGSFPFVHVLDINIDIFFKIL